MGKKYMLLEVEDTGEYKHFGEEDDGGEDNAARGTGVGLDAIDMDSVLGSVPRLEPLEVEAWEHGERTERLQRTLSRPRHSVRNKVLQSCKDDAVSSLGLRLFGGMLQYELPDWRRHKLNAGLMFLMVGRCPTPSHLTLKAPPFVFHSCLTVRKMETHRFFPFLSFLLSLPFIPPDASIRGRSRWWCWWWLPWAQSSTCCRCWHCRRRRRSTDKSIYELLQEWGTMHPC